MHRLRAERKLDGALLRFERAASQLLVERVRLPLGKAVQLEMPGAVAGDQGGEVTTAGHQHRGGRAARQQRDDLVVVGGVVQHDEHPFSGDQAPVHRGLGGRIGRDAVRGDAQRVEESAHHDRRFQRRVSR